MTDPFGDTRVDGIRFWFRGEARVVTGVAPTTSVLHWLRETERATGTKEGCNQGDCGACTVVLATPGADGVRVHTANSCLLPMPMLHGRALFTIEDVGSESALHPVQEAMVDSAGSQCGFCTPGFVMSMWCSAERRRGSRLPASRDEVAADLSGNLCRCTGYRPILDAAVAALEHLAGDDGAGPLDEASLQESLAGLGATSGLLVDGPDGAFVAPGSEEELAQALHERPGARVIAGGTDLMLTLRAVSAAQGAGLALVSTEWVRGMDAIDETATHLRIGAAATLDDAWAAIVGRLPHLARMWQRFASPAIRGLGTIGGNAANSSPIADLVPILHALDAEVVCRDVTGSRTVAIADFASGPRVNVLRPSEFISRIDLPLDGFGRDVRAHKVSRRFDDDISTVSGTFALRMGGDRIDEIRVVFGGMAPTVRRARRVEEVLQGRAWTREALRDAQDAVDADFEPITDHRATDGYRRRAAKGILERWWAETGASAPDTVTDVWAYR
ncbi:MAG: xanthine dehydrogenase small subunit [Actinobacteria bacterium]|nr:xanthine dehydrogenase small subunit [Actinomycetota bacterium]